MNLLLFKLKLVIYLFSFLVELLLNQIERIKLILLIIFIVFFVVNLLFFFLIKNKINNEKSHNDSTYSPASSELYLKSEKTEQEIRNEIIYWENIVKKQPNSRDALTNLSILKKILLEDEEAEILWEKARFLDPNNPIFKN